MNYIKQIQAFNDRLLSNPLSNGQIALWYALMYINNKCAWAEWFTAPNLSLEALSGLSRQGINKARNVLKQQGLIDFKSNGTKATSYRLITIYYLDTSDSVQDSIQSGVQDGIQDSLQGSVQVGVQNSSTLNKQNKTKQKNCANELFESLWNLYPNKKGKGQVSDAKKDVCFLWANVRVFFVQHIRPV